MTDSERAWFICIVEVIFVIEISVKQKCQLFTTKFGAQNYELQVSIFLFKIAVFKMRLVIRFVILLQYKYATALLKDQTYFLGLAWRGSRELQTETGIRERRLECGCGKSEALWSG